MYVGGMPRLAAMQYTFGTREVLPCLATSLRTIEGGCGAACLLKSSLLVVQKQAIFSKVGYEYVLLACVHFFAGCNSLSSTIVTIHCCRLFVRTPINAMMPAVRTLFLD